MTKTTEKVGFDSQLFGFNVGRIELRWKDLQRLHEFPTILDILRQAYASNFRLVYILGPEISFRSLPPSHGVLSSAGSELGASAIVNEWAIPGEIVDKKTKYVSRVSSFDLNEVAKKALGGSDFRISRFSDDVVQSIFPAHSSSFVSPSLSSSSQSSSSSSSQRCRSRASVIDVAHLELVDLAIMSGTHSRFCIDTRLPRKSFELMFSTWLRNSLTFQVADEVFIAHANLQTAATAEQQTSGKKIGFITVKRNPAANTVSIGLLAVAEEHRRKGVAAALLSRAVMWAAAEGNDRSLDGSSAGANHQAFDRHHADQMTISVVTQGTNTAACRCYETFGFAKSSVQDVYHVWLPDHLEPPFSMTAAELTALIPFSRQHFTGKELYYAAQLTSMGLNSSSHFTLQCAARIYELVCDVGSRGGGLLRRDGSRGGEGKGGGRRAAAAVVVVEQGESTGTAPSPSPQSSDAQKCNPMSDAPVSSMPATHNGMDDDEVDEGLDGEINGDCTPPCRRVVMVPSGTAALEMAALLCDLQPGDEVIMPSYTFSSTANAFVLRHAVPVFVDVRQDTLNIDERLIEAAITPRTKCICVVHYAGVPCEMDAICAIAARHALMLIEDAAQGFLSTYKGRALGTIGDLGCFSFHYTKNIICGEGGALLVNRSESLAARALTIWEKGTNRNDFMNGKIDRYEWVDVGSSFVPSELSCAVLWAQLQESERITERRMQHFARYTSRLLALLPTLAAPTVSGRESRTDHSTAYKTADTTLCDERSKATTSPGPCKQRLREVDEREEEKATKEGATAMGTAGWPRHNNKINEDRQEKSCVDGDGSGVGGGGGAHSFAHLVTSISRVPADCEHNAHIFYLLLRDAQTRAAVEKGLQARGISAFTHYVPLHSSPAGLRFGRVGVGSKRMAVTNRVGRTLLRLPMWTDLTPAMVDAVVDALADVLKELSEGDHEQIENS